MNYLTIVGNLGADAEVINSNGSKFVSFRVADSQRYTGQDGQQHESTQWIRCALNGDGGKLLPYLKQGTRVCVIGRMATRVYSSEKLRRMVAGVDLSVDRLELIGGKSADVPSMLYDSEGVGIKTHVVYYVDPEVAKAMKIKKGELGALFAENGRQFVVDYQGRVAPAVQQQPAEPANDTNNDPS